MCVVGGIPDLNQAVRSHCCKTLSNSLSLQRDMLGIDMQHEITLLRAVLAWQIYLHGALLLVRHMVGATQ